MSLYIFQTFDMWSWMPVAIGSGEGQSYGFSALFGILFMFLSWVPVIITVQYGKEGLFEELNDLREAENKERIQEQLESGVPGASQAGYGGAQAGGVQYGAAPYGGAQYGGAQYGYGPPPGAGGDQYGG